MAPWQVKLESVFQLGTETAGVIGLPENRWPGPGQYLSIQCPSFDHEFRPVNLFKVIGEKGVLSLGPLPGHWQPGDWLIVQSPQGRGFTLPSAARRVGLVAKNVSAVRLLALVAPALAQDAAISLFCDPVPAPDILNCLPSTIEVNPLSEMIENLGWADYLAVDVELAALDQLAAFLPQTEIQCEAQVLVHTSMPCRGLGNCGVCAVETTHGWRMVCEDGPVFPLKELLNVAG